MTAIKFCGITREEDLDVAIELGVDAVGFVLWPNSPRAISLDHAARLVRKLPSSIVPVGVFVRPTAEEIATSVDVTGIRVGQVHAVDDLSALADAPCELWAAIALTGSTISVPTGVTILLDAQDEERHGGTGTTIDWNAAGRIAATRRVMLAGGLTPQNVRNAIERARPYGVDVSSGIEERPGVKSAKLMRDFTRVVRSADLLDRRSLGEGG